MIFTARQLEAMHKSDGKIVLPYRARLTPLAADWIRSKKIEIGYCDAESPVTAKPAPTPPPAADSPAAGYCWWSDGPCGPSKAAIAMLARQAPLREIDRSSEPTSLVAVVKFLAGEIKASRCAGGILLVRTGAPAVVLANRCRSIRAILGTCLEAVEQGINQMAANVLIVEYPYQTLQQAQNLMTRFVRGRRELSEDVRRQIQELSSCE